MKARLTALACLAFTALSGCLSSGPGPEAGYAMDALREIVAQKPELFTSPVGAENPELLKLTPGILVDDETISMGNFIIRLDRRTYSLVHSMGNPDTDRFGVWMRQGRFIENREGTWTATDPVATAYEKHPD